MNLRLLITSMCLHNCPKCANKHYNLLKLPVCKPEDFKYYDSILITGGEPLMVPERMYKVIRQIRASSEAKVYIYTSYTLNSVRFINTVQASDGLTFGLHHQTDVIPLIRLTGLVQKFDQGLDTRSLRLRIFPEINVASKILKLWERVGWDIQPTEWLDHCPLPENEVLMRLEDTFK